jgi:hypothetical protein
MPRRSKSVFLFRRPVVLLLVLILLSVATLLRRTKFCHAVDKENCALLYKNYRLHDWRLVEWVRFPLLNKTQLSQQQVSLNFFIVRYNAIYCPQ